MLSLFARRTAQLSTVYRRCRVRSPGGHLTLPYLVARSYSLSYSVPAVSIGRAMILASFAVAVAAAGAAIGHRRLLYWWSWSPLMTVTVVLIDVLLCTVIAAAGAYASSRGGWGPTSNDFVNGLAPAVVVSGAARRSPRGVTAVETSVFGLVRFGHGLAEEAVADRVRRWARTLSDAALIEECTRLDTAGSGATSSLRTRSNWRRLRACELTTHDHRSWAEARASLENVLISGVQKEMCRKSA